MSGLEVLALAGAGLSAVGTVAGAEAARDQGKVAERNAALQAQALERQAREREAASQREAISQQRKTDLALSRVQAVSAASGGGATDPTVLDLMGDITQQGAYNRDAALYEGTAAAQGLDEQAAITRWKGEQAKRAAKMNANTTMLTGMSSFAEKASRMGSMGKGL